MSTVNAGLNGYNGSHTDGSYGSQNDTKIQVEQTTTTFLMDMMGKQSVSQIDMQETFGINRSKSNECHGAGEYEHGT
jgi:hypothetical protein